MSLSGGWPIIYSINDFEVVLNPVGVENFSVCKQYDIVVVTEHLVFVFEQILPFIIIHQGDGFIFKIAKSILIYYIQGTACSISF